MLKYEKIAEDLREDILRGKYQSGEQLALEKEMCAQYKVSRITIKRAVDASGQSGTGGEAPGLGNLSNP
jgi:GntR family transcriptional regulator